jgi:hypothetical protein
MDLISKGIFKKTLTKIDLFKIGLFKKELLDGIYF